MKGAFDFVPNKNWLSISTEAKDLIRRCLMLDPAERIRMWEVKLDPWAVDAVATAFKVAAARSPGAVHGGKCSSGPAALLPDVAGGLESQWSYLRRHSAVLEDAIARAVTDAALCDKLTIPALALGHVATSLVNGNYRKISPASIKEPVNYAPPALRALSKQLDVALEACLRVRVEDPVLFIGREMQRKWVR